MKLLTRKLTQTGDTIVEVLIAIVIISSVLVGAYTLTNKSTASTEDAQERSQAVQLVEGQLENLRNRVDSPTNNSMTGVACFGADGSTQPGSGVTCTNTPNGAGTQPAYIQVIVPPGGSAPAACSQASTSAYTVCTYWDSILDTGQNNVTMYYRPPTP